VTVHKAENISIFHGRVPLPKVYSPISESLRIACANGTEQPSAEVTLTHGWVEVGGTAVLPDPVTWKSGRASSGTALTPRFQMRGYAQPEA
jgi:hypothetical protein